VFEDSARSLFSSPAGAGPVATNAAPAAGRMGVSGWNFGHPSARASSGPAESGSGGSDAQSAFAGGHEAAKLGQGAPWVLPPPNGGFRPTASVVPGGRLASASAAASAGDGERSAPDGGSNAASGAASAPADKSSGKAPRQSVASRDSSAGPGFDEKLKIDARPTGAAGRAGADPNALGPDRANGGRGGTPGKRSPSAPPPDEDSSSAAGGVASAAAPATPPNGSGDEESEDGSGAPGKRRHRRRKGSAAPDPSAPSGAPAPVAPIAGIPPPPDPPTPPSAPEDEPEEARDPANPSGRTPREIAQVTPLVGSPQVGQGTPSGQAFSSTEGGAATVQPTMIQTATAKALEFPAGMPVDANGRGGWYRVEASGTNTTALHYADGKSLNPGKIAYITIPPDMKGVKLGDYGTASYGGKTVGVIVGDYGPVGVVGGGSLVTASALGINPDPKQGGVATGVTYLILPGSAGATPPASAAEVQTNAKAALDKAGIPIR
jgi:hypothetical protein